MNSNTGIEGSTRTPWQRSRNARVREKRIDRQATVSGCCSSSPCRCGWKRMWGKVAVASRQLCVSKNNTKPKCGQGLRKTSRTLWYAERVSASLAAHLHVICCTRQGNRQHKNSSAVYFIACRSAGYLCPVESWKKFDKGHKQHRERWFQLLSEFAYWDWQTCSLESFHSPVINFTDHIPGRLDVAGCDDDDQNNIFECPVTAVLLIG